VIIKESPKWLAMFIVVTFAPNGTNVGKATQFWEIVFNTCQKHPFVAMIARIKYDMLNSLKFLNEK
jgi:hypothetical protein